MRRCNTEPSLRPGSQFKKKADNVVINGIKIFFQKLTTQPHKRSWQNLTGAIKLSASVCIRRVLTSYDGFYGHGNEL
jgi:hypothetical protein